MYVYILLKDFVNVEIKYVEIIGVFQTLKLTNEYIKKHKIDQDKFVYFIEKRKMRID